MRHRDSANARPVAVAIAPDSCLRIDALAARPRRSGHTRDRRPNTSSSTSQKPFVRRRSSQASIYAATTDVSGHLMRPGTCQITCTSIKDARVARSPERNASAMTVRGRVRMLATHHYTLGRSDRPHRHRSVSPCQSETSYCVMSISAISTSLTLVDVLHRAREVRINDRGRQRSPDPIRTQGIRRNRICRVTS
jgi:hypothetical protein